MSVSDQQYYRVEVYDEDKSPSAGWTDITRHVVRIDKMQDSGTGDIPAVILFLNCLDGQFLTESNDAGTPSNATTPILDQFTLFRTTVEDDAGSSFSRITFLDNIQPQRGSSGLTAQVTTYAREKWLKDFKVTGHHFFEKMRNVVIDVLGAYNANRGSAQPKILAGTINIPTYPVGTFDFGPETNCYDALMQVISRLNQPVSAGGAGDYYELVFYDNAADPLNCIECHIFPLARTPAEPLVIKAVDIDTDSVSETKENISATVVVAQGQADTGSFPENIAEFTYKREEYANLPVWVSGVSYARGTYVRDPDSKTVYVSMFDPTTGDLTSNQWEEADEEKYVNGYVPGMVPAASKFVYSPWTENRQTQVYPLTNSTRVIVDSNLVVKDGTNYRNWADVRVKNLESTRINGYLYEDGTGSLPRSERLPEDFRILVDSHLPGSTGAELTGNDPFGLPYADSLVQWRNAEFIVIHRPERGDEVAVVDEGIVYAFDGDFGTESNPREARSSTDSAAASTYQWRSVGGQWLGLDCFHKPTSIGRVAGLAKPVGGGQNSSIQVKYEFTESQDTVDLFDALVAVFFNIYDIGVAIIDTIIDFFTTDAAYRYGWWGTLFHAPFPVYKVGAAEVGSMYKNGTVDLYGLNRTRSATAYRDASYTAEYGQDLGQLTGISFLFHFNYTIAGYNVPFTANLPFRVFMYDTEDNVWVTDINYRFLGDTQLFTIPFSSFRIYRARNPVSLTLEDTIYNILEPELKVLEIFETRRVKHIGIQWQQPYDSAGRFNPVNLDQWFTQLGANLLSSNVTMTGTIDAFHFTKAPIVVERAGTSTEQGKYHIMENIRQYPSISNVEQLRRIARAEADLAAFRRDNFTVTVTGRCDIKAGQAVYLEDSDIIPDTVTETIAGFPHTYQRKKLAVRKVNHTINAGSGPAGFKTILTLAARINP